MPRRVGIIGGGLAGLCTARLCIEKGWPYTLITPEMPKQSPKRLLLNCNSINTLTALGIQPKIQDTYTTLQITQRHSFSSLLLQAKDHQLPALAHAVSYNDLLPDLTKDLNIHINTAQKITSSDDHVVVHTKDKQHEFDVLIACDGTYSPTRQQLGIDITWGPAGCAQIITGHIEAPHLMLRFSHKLSIAVLPGKYGQLIISGPSDLTQCKPSLEELSTFLPASVHIHSIKRIHPIHFTPMLASCIYKNNCLLLGDAAVAISPMAAQGFNQTLANITKLQQLNALSPTTLSMLSKDIAEDNQKLWGYMNQLSQHPLKRKLALAASVFVPSIQSSLIHFGNRYGCTT